jgi:hypothetical protein
VVDPVSICRSMHIVRDLQAPLEEGGQRRARHHGSAPIVLQAMAYMMRSCYDGHVRDLMWEGDLAAGGVWLF